MEKEINIDWLSQVSRLEVINHTTNNHAIGRLLVMYLNKGSLEFSIQDNGRTLKVFINDKPSTP